MNCGYAPLMKPLGSNALIAAGGALALILLIAAVWATSMSTPTQLALTGLLVLIAVGILAVGVPRGTSDQRAPVDQDADQRDRMQDRVP